MLKNSFEFYIYYVSQLRNPNLNIQYYAESGIRDQRAYGDLWRVIW
jgi:hypothetical protein